MDVEMRNGLKSLIERGAPSHLVAGFLIRSMGGYRQKSVKRADDIDTISFALDQFAAQFMWPHDASKPKP
jgi:hypothetical protein